MPIPRISVILCTHNPKHNYISRVLDGLRGQTLPFDQWELVLVDNHSSPPLEQQVTTTGLPARIIHEPKLGLTHARLAGINTAKAPTLIFVDDDNVLAFSYLEVALQISEARPELGAWGGSCIGEFEVDPPPWSQPYLSYLALRKVTKSIVTKNYDISTVPFGAGLCIRHEIASTYGTSASNNEKRQMLGRSGASLMSGEDTDMVFTAVDLGFYYGLEPALSLLHLMPASRLSPHYLARLLEGISVSTPIVLRLHGITSISEFSSVFQQWLRAYRLWRQPGPIWQLERARERGVKRARNILENWDSPARAGA